MTRRGGQQNRSRQRTTAGDGRHASAPPGRKRRGSIDDAAPLAPVRPAGSKRERVLYVGCEGEKTEPDYLDYLNERFGRGDGDRQPFRIQPVWKKDGMVPAQVVESVREYAAEDEAWALFDRDRHPDVTEAFEAAAACSVELGFSHPSFDLWLLLHFQAFGGRQSGSSKIVVEKLRAADPAYRRFDKSNDKSVQGNRRTALHGKAEAAVAHAKSLVTQCEYGSCKGSNAVHTPVRKNDPANPDHLPQSSRKWSARSGHAPGCPALDRDPSTDVWRLLASLGISGD